jgi:hypothetical protein
MHMCFRESFEDDVALFDFHGWGVRDEEAQ